MRRTLRRRVASAVAFLSTFAVGMPAVTGTDVPTAAAAEATATTVAGRAGLTTGPGILWASDAEQTADYDAVVASGATWTTLDIDWNHIQSDGPNSWRWNAATDRALLNARAHGLKVIGVAAYSPTWARRADCPPGELHCFPERASDYARFLGQAAARYGSQAPIERLRGAVKVWSLWNEPNHREFSMPRPDPDKYADMVKQAYAAIKAADPNAIVITGGTSPAPDASDGTEYSPLTWLRGLYARGAGSSFDGVAHHPYSFPTNPLDNQPWNSFLQSQRLYDVMVENGDRHKKVWGTEMGAPTGTASDALTPEQQAQWVRDYYLGWNTTMRSFTGPLIWFTVRDMGTNPANKWDNLGLQTKARVPKPAWSAFQSVMGGGVAVPPRDLSGLAIPAKGRRVAASPRGGYYTLASNGLVTAHGGAPYFGSPSLPYGLARSIVVTRSGRGYLVLDGFGGVHKYGRARLGDVGAASTPYFGWDIARDLALAPDGRGYAVLDGFGGIHRGGSAPAVRGTPYWSGFDIARAFSYAPDSRGVYVLDGFGGVHAGGSAVARRGPYWAGWDIARDILVAPDNSGFVVVDGFGNVHRAGAMPAVHANFASRQWDHAGGVAIVDGGYVVAG